MKDSARLFNCARCHVQVLICSECDRGNIYCSTADCAQQARSASCHRANQRYQSTYQGRLLHAQRQRRYREEVNKKVTDQGSPPLPSDDVLRPGPDEAIKERTEGKCVTTSCCHFCGRGDFKWQRLDFLRRDDRYKTPLLSWPAGP